MFVLDSFLHWVLNTVTTAVEAEMNDDTALRERLLEAELRREMGEISDEEFAGIEADLLERIRATRERREGTGPLAFGGAEPMEIRADAGLQVEASVSGDFHDPAEAPPTQTTILDAPGRSHSPARAGRRAARPRTSGRVRASRTSVP